MPLSAAECATDCVPVLACARAQRERLRISDVLRLAAGLLDNVGKLSELPNMDLPGEPSYV